MTAPALESLSMFCRWMAESGVSLGTRTRGRRSFSMQSAALSMRLPETPVATLASVPIEHGQIIIAFTRAEPLAAEAVRSSYGRLLNLPFKERPFDARAAFMVSAGLSAQSRPSSSFNRRKPVGEMMSSTSSPLERSSPMSLIPYRAPLAPVRATRYPANFSPVRRGLASTPF